MPIIPTYTKREFIKRPAVDSSAPAPVRLVAAYENNLTRTAELLPQAVGIATKLGGLTGAAGSASALPGEENLRVRETLLNTVQKEMAGGTVSVKALEQAAVKNFTPQTADGPAAQDYAVLHRAVQDVQQKADLTKEQTALEKEKTLTTQVGSLVRSPQALEAYLSTQLASYQKQLRHSGLSEEAAHTKARAVASQTVEENICRSLACGDWQAAEAMISKHGDKLSGSIRDVCADKIRTVFAQRQAEQLWEEGRLETDGSSAQIYRYALEHIAEPDEALNSAMRQTLQAVSRRESAREHGAAAQTLASVAQLSSTEALQLLDSKNTLPADELAHVRPGGFIF